MGTFVFKWPHLEAKEVYVTGTFDDWGQSEKLNKVGETFEKEVNLPDASVNILYKFVVDGIWTIDQTAPQEDDGHHNVNNILKPEDIKKHSSDAAQGAAAGVLGGAAAGGLGAALLSGVHPESTTTKLAGDVPRENEKLGAFAEQISKDAPPLERKQSPPGAFPETPFDEPNSFAVNPIPASSGPSNPISVPAGEKLPDLKGITGNTLNSHATTSKEDYEKDASSAVPEEKSYGISPIPASSGTSNPISLPAGDKLPEKESITGNNLESHATTSKEDYEKAGSSAFPQEKSFGVDPIPASAGIGNPVSVSAGESVKQHRDLLPQSLDANATTSKEDYEKAGSTAMPIGGAGDGAADPNDSAFSVPNKTKDMIPESSLPMSGEAKDTIGTGPFLQSSGPGTSTAALAGQVPFEPKSKAIVVNEETPSASNLFTQSSGPDTTTADLAGRVPLESGSKATVDSETPSAANAFIQSSGPGTTSGGLAGAVPLESKSKAAMDEEAPSGSSPFTQSSGPGTTTAALAGQVPLESRSEGTAIADEAPSATLNGPAPDVPEVVKESLSQAHKSPEAAASPEAVSEKKEVERELLQEVRSTDAVGEPAPTATAATSATAPAASGVDPKVMGNGKQPAQGAEEGFQPSGDVSPLGEDVNAIAPAPSSPMVTTGVGESKTSTTSTPQKPTTPASSAASSPATTENVKDKKKKNRLSFFGKLKEKLKG